MNATTPAERQRARRARLAAQGLVEVSVTVPKATVERLQKYCARLRKEGETKQPK